MDILQDAVMAVAAALLVMAFCSGVKAACRRKLRRDKKRKG